MLRSAAPAESAPTIAILALQRAAGNAAVSALLAPLTVLPRRGLQRQIVNAKKELMSFPEVRAAIKRDPSARINTETAMRQLLDMQLDTGTQYAIDEIIHALGGGPRHVAREQEGDLVLHPPLPVDELDLAAIAGTHRSVAPTFTDPNFTVDGTANQLVGNPNLIRSNDAFVLNVFRSTPPGAPQGQVATWSMNNRRLKAMQQAERRLRQTGRSLPKIRITWATQEEMNYAVGPGKFSNAGRAEVGFHSTATQTQRFAVLTASNASNRPSEELVAQALNSKDPETIAKLLDL